MKNNCLYDCGRHVVPPASFKFSPANYHYCPSLRNKDVSYLYHPPVITRQQYLVFLFSPFIARRRLTLFNCYLSLRGNVVAVAISILSTLRSAVARREGRSSTTLRRTIVRGSVIKKTALITSPILIFLCIFVCRYNVIVVYVICGARSPCIAFTDRLPLCLATRIIYGF